MLAYHLGWGDCFNLLPSRHSHCLFRFTTGWTSFKMELAPVMTLKRRCGMGLCQVGLPAPYAASGTVIASCAFSNSPVLSCHTSRCARHTRPFLPWKYLPGRSPFVADMLICNSLQNKNYILVLYWGQRRTRLNIVWMWPDCSRTNWS